MRKILISLALATASVGGVAATPALAQSYGYAPARQIQRDINQLENRIERAAQRGTISRREAVSLRREANQIDRLFSRYQRNGLNRAEVNELRGRINRVEARLRVERRDRDGRRW